MQDLFYLIGRSIKVMVECQVIRDGLKVLVKQSVIVNGTYDISIDEYPLAP